MLEKKITPAILKSIRDNPEFHSGLYEIKVAKKTMYASQFPEHQRRALTLAKEKAIYFKIPDSGYQNPADAFVLKKSDAYLVIYFSVKPKAEVWAISIEKIPMGIGNIGIDFARENGTRVVF